MDSLFKKFLLLVICCCLCTNANAEIPKKVKVSSNDSTAGYLNGKLVAGSGITFTENSDGGNETLTIEANAGSGDITAVGDITSGAAFTATAGNDGTTLYFEGATSNGNEVALTSADPGADVTVTIQASTHTLVGRDTTDTLTNKTIDADSNTLSNIENADIKASAGIVYSKLSLTDSLREADLKVVDTASDEDIFTYESTTGDFEWHTIDQMIAVMSAGSLPNDSVLEADLKVVDAAGDEECLTYESTAGDFEWQSCSAGSGDITAVGPGYSDGAAFTDGKVSTGTTMLIWEGTTDNTNELSVISPSADPGSDIDITLPSATGTLATLAGTETLTNKTLAAADNVIGADTAVALAANGSNCAAGSWAAGVDASGAAESCTADDDSPDNDGEVPNSLTVNLQADSTVPNGAAPTVDAVGEVAVDTTDDQFVYFGGSKRVLTPKRSFGLTYESPTSSDLFHFYRAQDNITITDIECIVDPAGTGESAVIDIQECDSTGDNCTTVDATITCDNDGAADDGTFTNPSIDANDWVALDGGAVTGTVSVVGVTVYYTVDSE